MQINGESPSIQQLLNRASAEAPGGTNENISNRRPENSSDSGERPVSNVARCPCAGVGGDWFLCRDLSGHQLFVGALVVAALTMSCRTGKRAGVNVRRIPGLRDDARLGDPGLAISVIDESGAEVHREQVYKGLAIP